MSLPTLAPVVAERIFNSLPEGLAIAGLAWVLLQIVGRQNSGTRFAVWFAALVAIAGVPFIGAAASGSSSPMASIPHAPLTLPASWALFIFLGWALIASLAIVRVGWGFLHVWALRRNSVAIEIADLNPQLQSTIRELSRGRAVVVCKSDHVRTPTAIGFLKPMIVVPSWTWEELSAPELSAVLAHEFAHLRRRDDWTNLAQKIVRAVFFFHPAVWWIENRLSLEREMACDDAVLARTSDPRGYAECLISLAEKRSIHRGLAMAQAAVDRVRATSRRIAQIMDVNRPSSTRMWKPAVVILSLFSTVGLGTVSYAPKLVGFEQSAPVVIPNRTAPTLAAARIANSPAVQTAGVTPQRSSRTVANNAVAIRHQRTAGTNVVPVRMKLKQGRQPAVLQAKADAKSPMLATEVVMMRGERIDGETAQGATFSVWRLSIVRARGQQVLEEQIIVKLM